jgi:hypothetical protein
MPATRMIAVPGGRKESVMTPRGRIRVVMTISIWVSAWLVSIFASVLVPCGCSIFASVLVPCGCPIFVPMLIGALLVMLVSMFILPVLRVKAEWSQAGHGERAENK